MPTDVWHRPRNVWPVSPVALIAGAQARRRKFAVLSLLDAFGFWRAYYCANSDGVQQPADELDDRVDAISVLGTTPSRITASSEHADTPDVDHTLEPVEGVLAVLDSGSAAGTNKFGLLLALIDLAPTVPASGFITDEELAAKLLEVHWDHARPYGGHVLRQVISPNKDNAVVITEVERLQAHLAHAGLQTGPFERVRNLIGAPEWASAIVRVVKATRANPLRRLQTLDRQQVVFLYEIERGGLRFLPHALDGLVRFGPVLRDLVQFRFVRFVAGANRKTLGTPVEDELAKHLFGAERHMPPVALRLGLWEAQDKKCLYTRTPLPVPTAAAVSSLDHVVPWARVRVSAVENFVLTTKQVNSAKSSLLLAPALVRRWCEHVGEHGDTMRRLATEHGWPMDLKRVTAVAATLYRRASDGIATWAGPGEVVLLDDLGRAEIDAALAGIT